LGDEVPSIKQNKRGIAETTGVADKNMLASMNLNEVENTDTCDNLEYVRRDTLDF
jgi:pyruvate formate-lyase activating enzyme-like uncharacterized protein